MCPVLGPKNGDIFQIVSSYKFTINEFIGQNLPKRINFWTIPQKVTKIFRSVAAKGTLWVLFDTNFLLETS